MIIAHRGFGNNRIQDFKAALKQTKAVEFDLRLTKDKRIIICHDSNFYALTGHTGSVRKMTYSQIKQIPFFIEHPELIPPLFLTDFVPIAKEYKVIDIEIKPNHYRWLDFWFYQRAFNILRRRTKAEIIISSFSNEVMDWMTRRMSHRKFKFGYIFFSMFMINENIKNRCDYLMPRWELLLSHRHQEWFQNQTQKIYPWTVSEQEEVDRIKSLYPPGKIGGWIGNKVLEE